MPEPTIDPTTALATHRRLCAERPHSPGLTILMGGSREALIAAGRLWVAPDVTEARWFAAELPPVPGAFRPRLILWRYEQSRRPVLGQLDAWEAVDLPGPGHRREIEGPMMRVVVDLAPEDHVAPVDPPSWRATADLEVLVRCHLLVAESMPPGTVTPFDRA